MTDHNALVWLLLSNGVALGYAIWNRFRFAPSIALMIVAGTMFTFTLVLLNGDEPKRWFFVAPPWFVSRIVLASVALIVLVGVWRVGWRALHAEPFAFGFAAIGVLVVPAMLIPMALGLAPKLTVSTHSIVVFSFLLAGMLCLALLLALIEAGLPTAPQGTFLAAAVLVLLCGAVTTIGFLEVALDIGAIRNVFEAGVIETRASSTLLNPNFLALWLVPCVFTALYLAVQGMRIWSYVLIAFAALGLNLSGSRSVVAVLAASMVVLYVLGRFCSRTTGAAIVQALGVMTRGAIMGLVVGLLAAAMLGPVAVDRYLAVTTRMIAWPVQVWSEGAAYQSITGRLDVGSLYRGVQPVGTGIVDSAYLFLFGTNPLALLLLVGFFAWLGYLAIKQWWQRRDVTSCLRGAMWSFIVLIGFMGQFYWAFPTWIVLSVMLSWMFWDIIKIAPNTLPE